MFEEFYAPIPDLNAYLDRIGVSACPPSADFLDELITGHQQRIPFENLDVYGPGAEVPIDPASVFRKIVTRRRGGYCFEMNTLFLSALKALGFDAWPVAVRINNPEVVFPICSHMAVVVRLDGRRLYCDVGFGGPCPRRALELDSSAAQDSAGFQFLFTREPENHVRMHILKDGAEENWLQFRDEPALPMDFLPLNEYQSKNSRSYFRRNRVVNLCLPEGSKALSGDTLTIRDGGRVEVIRAGDDRELRGLLREHFGLEL